MYLLFVLICKIKCQNQQTFCMKRFSKKVFSLVFEILKKSCASHQYMKLKIHVPAWFLCSDLSCQLLRLSSLTNTSSPQSIVGNSCHHELLSAGFSN